MRASCWSLRDAHAAKEEEVCNAKTFHTALTRMGPCLGPEITEGKLVTQRLRPFHASAS
jgi:hypothetical protein